MEKWYKSTVYHRNQNYKTNHNN